MPDKLATKSRVVEEMLVELDDIVDRRLHDYGIIFTLWNNVFYPLTFYFIRCSSCERDVVFLLCGKAFSFSKMMMMMMNRA